MQGDFRYGYAAHVHAVTLVNHGGGITDTYTYDANGNTLAPAAQLPRKQVPGSAGVTCRKENGIYYKQLYNVENRLYSVTQRSNSCSGTVNPTRPCVPSGCGRNTLPISCGFREGGGSTLACSRRTGD